jgi:hypothetical protein
MNQNEFTKDIALFRRTGHQDCDNVMNPEELRELFGPLPTTTQIRKWLLEDVTPKDFKDSLDFPEDATDAQKQKLLEAWAEGWAETASAFMKNDMTERAYRRVFHEPAGGLLEEGWWVTMENKNRLGPFTSQKQARDRAVAVEEEDEDR